MGEPLRCQSCEQVIAGDFTVCDECGGTVCPECTGDNEDYCQECEDDGYAY